MNQPPYVCHPRKCISCDNQIKQDGKTPEERKIPGVYDEVTFHLSNNSKMKVGICNVCKAQSGNLNASAALQAIQDFWKQTIRKSRREDLEKFSGHLSVQKVEA